MPCNFLKRGLQANGLRLNCVFDTVKLTNPQISLDLAIKKMWLATCQQKFAKPQHIQDWSFEMKVGPLGRMLSLHTFPSLPFSVTSAAIADFPSSKERTLLNTGTKSWERSSSLWKTSLLIVHQKQVEPLSLSWWEGSIANEHISHWIKKITLMQCVLQSFGW